MTSLAKVQSILAFCLIVFAVYVSSLFLLKKASDAGNHFTDKNGTRVKFFSMNPVENLRMISFVCGRKTGIAKVDFLKRVVQGVFLTYLLFFLALAIAVNIAGS